MKGDNHQQQGRQLSSTRQI